MPEMDGFEATKHILTAGNPNSKTPIFALTADVTAENNETSWGWFIDRKITKPNIDGVVGSEVTLHDPSVPNDKLLLHLNPPLARSCDKPRLPEDFIYFDHRQPRNIA